MGPLVLSKINVFDSPILTVKTIGGNDAHLVIDNGATSSLMEQNEPKTQNLAIHPTKHRVVQIDGESKLKVLGEVHTLYNRNGIFLPFHGLVVKSNECSYNCWY